MRAKRAKQYRKLMHQYQITFSFREPYQVLLDAGIIQAAARFKMRLGSLLATTLHGEIKPMITQCCIRHLYDTTATTPAEKADKDAWITVAKAAERRMCGHHELPAPLGAEECILSVLDPKGAGTNKHRYVVATQDYEVRARLRKVAGVPLVYINRSVMILEPMGQRTEEVRESEEKSKIRSGLKSRRALMGSLGVKRKRDEDEAGEEGGISRSSVSAADGSAVAPKKQKKAKGLKGPNPLAVKKAKKEPVKTTQPPAVGEQAPTLRRTSETGTQLHHGGDDIETISHDGIQDDAADTTRKRRRKRKPSNKGGEGGSDGEAGGPSLPIIV